MQLKRSSKALPSKLNACCSGKNATGIWILRRWRTGEKGAINECTILNEKTGYWKLKGPGSRDLAWYNTNTTRALCTLSGLIYVMDKSLKRFSKKKINNVEAYCIIYQYVSCISSIQFKWRSFFGILLSFLRYMKRNNFVLNLPCRYILANLLDSYTIFFCISIIYPNCHDLFRKLKGIIQLKYKSQLQLLAQTVPIRFRMEFPNLLIIRVTRTTWFK